MYSKKFIATLVYYAAATIAIAIFRDANLFQKLISEFTEFIQELED